MSIEDIQKDLVWVNRYSNTDEPDKHGRLARQLFYKGKRFCLITLERKLPIFCLITLERKLPITVYRVIDYFPANGNDSPCYVDNSIDDLVIIKQKAEQRFIKFLNDIL